MIYNQCYENIAWSMHYGSKTQATHKVWDASFEFLIVEKWKRRVIILLDNFANPLHHRLPDHNASKFNDKSRLFVLMGYMRSAQTHILSLSLTDPLTHTYFSHLLIPGAPILTKWVKYSPFSSQDNAVSTAPLEKSFKGGLRKFNSHLCINTSQTEKRAPTRVYYRMK